MTAPTGPHPPRLHPKIGDMSEVPATAAAAIRSITNQEGERLPDEVRADLENRLGASFRDVRIHTGADATESARVINARAYTTGNHIVFDSARYSPTTLQGRRTLAHELSHVIQQRRGQVTGTALPGGMTLSDPEDASERTAEASAESAMTRSTTPQRPFLSSDISAPEFHNSRFRPLSHSGLTAVQRDSPRGHVSSVELSCADSSMVVHTSERDVRYVLDSCDLSEGDYDAEVVRRRDGGIDFALGSQAPQGTRFTYSYRIGPGQPAPATLFIGQSRVRVVAHAAPARADSGRATVSVQVVDNATFEARYGARVQDMPEGQPVGLDFLQALNACAMPGLGTGVAGSALPPVPVGAMANPLRTVPMQSLIPLPGAPLRTLAPAGESSLLVGWQAPLQSVPPVGHNLVGITSEGVTEWFHFAGGLGRGPSGLFQGYWASGFEAVGRDVLRPGTVTALQATPEQIAAARAAATSGLGVEGQTWAWLGPNCTTTARSVLTSAGVDLPFWARSPRLLQLGIRYGKVIAEGAPVAIRAGGYVLLVVAVASSVEEVLTAPPEQQGVTATREAGGLAGGWVGAALSSALAGTFVCAESGPGAFVCALGFGLVGGATGTVVGRDLGERAGQSMQDIGHLLSNPAQLTEAATQMFGTPEQRRQYYEYRELMEDLGL